MSRRRHSADDEPHFLVRSLAATFREGSSIAPHSHSWGQLIYVASGVLSAWTEFGSWVAPPHWAVWAPAGVAHSARFSGAASLQTLYVNPALDNLPARSAVVTVSPLLRELIQRTVEIGMLDGREPSHVAMANLIVHELRTHPTPPLDLPLPHSAPLRLVSERLLREPQDRSTHAALARRAGLSVRSLERAFAAETGLALGAWRRQARFLFALRRLGAGVPVKQAASESGYRSPSAFVAAFRSALGTTPGGYFAAGRSAAARRR